MRRAQRAGRPDHVVTAVRPGTGSGLIAELARSPEAGSHGAAERVSPEVAAVPVRDLPPTRLAPV
jgi:hypothetical protein